MNGFSIKGLGQETSKVGLKTPNNNDKVIVGGPGDISNFQTGILVTGTSHAKVDLMILAQNKIGVKIQSANYGVREKILSISNRLDEIVGER
jgi:hypothetical protein